MSTKDCIHSIGAITINTDTQIVSLDELHMIVRQNKAFNEALTEKELRFTKKRTENIEHYLSERNPREFKLFDYCPHCGIKIKRYLTLLGGK
jgi:hypothetical protein